MLQRIPYLTASAVPKPRSRKNSGNFIDLDYTARLEDDLDRIARGDADWEKVVTEASFAVIALARRAGLWYDPLVPRAAKKP